MKVRENGSGVSFNRVGRHGREKIRRKEERGGKKKGKVEEDDEKDSTRDWKATKSRRKTNEEPFPPDSGDSRAKLRISNFARKSPRCEFLPRE